MRTRVENCPGGVSVVVPEAVAARAGLRGGEHADLEVSADRLVVRPVGASALIDLIAGITPDNLHEEWAAGPPAGSERL